MSTSAIPSPPPAPPLPLALHQLPPIRYSILDQIDAAAKADPSKVMLACLGTEWLLMSVSYTKQIIEMQKQPSFQNKVKFFYINEEIEREFCEASDLIVGFPALMLWTTGTRVVFQRPGWAASPLIVGPFPEVRIESLLSLVAEQSASIKENPKFVLKLTF